MDEKELQRKCNKLEEILEKDTDRGAAILGLAYIEERLREILLNNLRNSKETERFIDVKMGSFASKCDLAFAIGLINEQEWNGLNLLRKIRNQFAHDFLEDLVFDNPSIATLCGNLLFDDHLWVSGKKVKSNRDKFICSVFILGRSLLFRVRPEDRLELLHE